jgi:hypothetical protein
VNRETESLARRTFELGLADARCNNAFGHAIEKVALDAHPPAREFNDWSSCEASKLNLPYADCFNQSRPLLIAEPVSTVHRSIRQ